MLKNTIIALSTNLVALVASIGAMFKINNKFVILLSEMGQHGIMAFCAVSDSRYFNSANMLYYLIYVSAAIVAVVLGNYLLNKFDCSR